MGKRRLIMALALAMVCLCAFSRDIKNTQTERDYPLIDYPYLIEDSDWFWLNEEIGKYEPKKDSTNIDHFVYESHPQYKVSNEYYVFDKAGNLVHCHNAPVFGTGVRNYFISNVLMSDFENGKGSSGLSAEQLDEVKSDISGIANYTFDFDGFPETTSPVMNYISKLYLARKNIFIVQPILIREGDNSFCFVLGKGDNTYSLTCNYVGKGGFKVERELKVEKGKKQTNMAKQKKGMVPPPPPPTNSKNDKTLVLVEKMPSFNGSINAWLANNLQYPVEAAENAIEGKVIVRFVVGKDGTISNASIIKSVSPSLDGESLRVVRAMPKWNPGINEGKPAAVWFSLPITFRLQ